MSALAPTLQAFFTEHLTGQRQASPHTIAAYRDTMRLLLRFAQQQTAKEPSALNIDDPRRAADRGVPGSPAARAFEQREDAQREAGGHPLAVSVRRVASSRARRSHPARPRDPSQAF